ncbi:hypothetical protein DFH09DRAFT_1087910 [Mycena vulgaris]|nr:hypothetical protein DFH09DRAFT_1087910 [Mycena vulgaris]
MLLLPSRLSWPLISPALWSALAARPLRLLGTTVTEPQSYAMAPTGVGGTHRDQLYPNYPVMGSEFEENVVRLAYIPRGTRGQSNAKDKRRERQNPGLKDWNGQREYEKTESADVEPKALDKRRPHPSSPTLHPRYRSSSTGLLPGTDTLKVVSRSLRQAEVQSLARLRAGKCDGLSVGSPPEDRGIVGRASGYGSTRVLFRNLLDADGELGEHVQRLVRELELQRDVFQYSFNAHEMVFLRPP